MNNNYTEKYLRGEYSNILMILSDAIGTQSFYNYYGDDKEYLRNCINKIRYNKKKRIRNKYRNILLKVFDEWYVEELIEYF